MPETLVEKIEQRRKEYDAKWAHKIAAEPTMLTFWAWMLTFAAFAGIGIALVKFFPC